MTKRVLITGSQGFTGRYMVAELEAAGYEVFGLGSQKISADDYYQVDLNDKDQLGCVIKQIMPDVVIHLAALAYVAHGDANAFYQVNLIGTRNLLEVLTAFEKRPECVLLASSANVYGNQAEGVLSETTTPAPANDYAVSKLAMEYMARTWMQKLPIVIARPFNYTGIGQSEQFLLPKIISHFRRYAPTIELGNLDVCRDFSDVRAVVKAYLGLITKRPIGEVYNIASGRAHSLRDVLAMCSKITGHSIDIRINPAFIRANEVKTLCGDASKLNTLLGRWERPLLEETLQWMLEVDE